MNGARNERAGKHTTRRFKPSMRERDGERELRINFTRSQVARPRRGEGKHKDVEDRKESKNERGKGWYNESAQAALTARVTLVALTTTPQRRGAT